MADRPNRWQKARADSKGFTRWRDLVSLLAGGALGVLGLIAFDVNAPAAQEVIVVVATATAAFVLLPGVELAWNYLKAPMRLLEDRVESLERGSVVSPPTSASSGAPVSRGEVLRAVQMTERELQDSRSHMERWPTVWYSGTGIKDKIWQQQEPILAAYSGGEDAYGAITAFYRERERLDHDAEVRWRGGDKAELTEEEHQHGMRLIDEAIDRLRELRDELGDSK